MFNLQDRVKKSASKILDNIVFNLVLTAILILPIILFEITKRLILINATATTIFLILIYIVSILLGVQNKKLKKKLLATESLQAQLVDTKSRLKDALMMIPLNAKYIPEIFVYDFGWARSWESDLRPICKKCHSLCIPVGFPGSSFFKCRDCQETYQITSIHSSEYLDVKAIHAEINRKHRHESLKNLLRLNIRLRIHWYLLPRIDIFEL